ncbi:hypothetical protein EJ08DRAFT_43758 [Tothia fuscella]|uniref:Uncharacterized protein n=1 Tax=Tothia fuscella TaxID=1048955 RepID=A0A9P4TTC4_9PEZI|nr:hypothetical protein EJ08DRAFT_43758 [Tothia fuscella]
MRLLEAPSTLLAVVAILLTSTQPAISTPLSKLTDLIHQKLEERGDDTLFQNATIAPRALVCSAGQQNCGYYGQICCSASSETCGTNAHNEAICVAGAGVAALAPVAPTGTGLWQTYTSTWVETNTVTRTSVWSSWVPATATVAVVGTGAPCSPNWANNESQCGTKCCISGTYCYDPNTGECRSSGNGGFTTTGVGFAPPLRPTTMSNGVVTTMTMSPTTTVAFQTPVPTGSSTAGITAGASSGGLSGGAIAGIVIGVLAGLILLALICLCCCFKAAADGLLAILGIGKKKKSRRTVVEEEYISEHHRHGSGSGSRRWYGSAAGSRPSRPPPPPAKKAGGGFGGLLTGAAGLAGLAAVLGMKRKHDRKHEKSDVSSYTGSGSSYTYDYTSSSSSDGRTRHSSRR